MSRRGLTILLHWTLAFLLLALTKAESTAPALRWAWVGAGGLFVGLALVRGLAGRPGPKLSGIARQIHGPSHWAMYGLVGLSALLNALALLGRIDEAPARTSLLVLLAFACFHAVFHLWRHTSLNDGALRLMMPRIWHKYL